MKKQVLYIFKIFKIQAPTKNSSFTIFTHKDEHFAKKKKRMKYKKVKISEFGTFVNILLQPLAQHK